MAAGCISTEEGALETRQSLSERVSSFLERRSGWVIAAVPAITLLLVVPLFTLAPGEQASSEPGGRVFDLRDEVNDHLPPRVYTVSFIAEAKSGDVLTQAPLWELYQNQQRLLRADQEGRLHPPGLEAQPFLYNGFDVDRQQPIIGVFSTADAVQEVLTQDPRLNTTLEHATDDQVKMAVSQVLSDPRYRLIRDFQLSKKATRERRTVAGQEIDYWSSPALFAFVNADNEKLGGGGLEINLGGGPTVRQKEEFARNVQAILRGDQQTYNMWGIAIDINLESEEEGRTAFPFILATGIAVLIIVGISLRSRRAVFLTAVGLLILVVWLKGLSNLVGLRSSLTLDLIVPIAMISLGVDFAIHALHRYREERHRGYQPRRALRVGFAGVLGALGLAMVTDSIAFLSNIPSGIETVVGFGIAAGIAVFSAFVVLGVFVPLVSMRLDARKPRVAPALAEATSRSADPVDSPGGRGRFSPERMIVPLVVNLARRRYLVLPIVAGMTAVAVFFAFQLEPRLDAKEFFDSGSDFVISLDKIDEHIGQTQGEPGIIYITGDLTDPRALSAIRDFSQVLRQNPYVGLNRDGEVNFQARTIFHLLEQVMDSRYARTQIEAATGVAITDANDDGIPDTQEQLRATYDYIVQKGVPLNETTLIYDAAEVRETLFHDPTGAQEDATMLVVGIPGTREQATVTAARKALEADLEILSGAPSVSAGLTGSPFTREASLNATTRALNISLPLAVALCFLAIAFFTRSLRLAFVTVIPIGLVVAWLYAFMYLAGFHLNFVTATIAAVSIGVGIDYSIHVTQRFREELGKTGERFQALRQTARGTGVALLGSAASSVVGFAIMGFAPMPMFSAYGILTATMIFLAAAAALVVLPSLLLVVTPAATVSGAANPVE